MKKTNSVVITILVAVIVGALGFFGGMQYSRMQRVRGFGAGAGQFGQGAMGRFGGAGGNRPVMGQITSMDSNSLTVKLPDGSSKIVILSGSTSINKQASGTKEDLKNGENVMIIGTTNSDGSVTATMVNLNPMMRGGMGGGMNATPSAQ